MIEEAVVFKTPDGKTFDTREHAEAYVRTLEIEGRINAYLDQLQGTDRARGRQASAVRRFLLWELGQHAEVEECPEP